MLQILGYHLIPRIYKPSFALDTGGLDPLRPPDISVRVSRTPVVTTVTQGAAKAAVVAFDSGTSCSNAVYLINGVLVPNFTSAASFAEASAIVASGVVPAPSAAPVPEAVPVSG